MMTSSTELGDAAVVVIGLGVSGLAAADALVGTGIATLSVVDTRDTPALQDRAARLRASGVDARAGVSDLAVLARGDVVVVSPGVAPTNPVLAAAISAGGRIWSEPELAWRLNAGRSRLVAVTGTNGKTTTTELLAACLGAPFGGNIGTPLTTLLARSDAPPLVVAELSSFQLRFTEGLRADVGVLLNVAPDHLDWHGTLDDYAAAKARVWRNQRREGGQGLAGQDWAVVNADDAGGRSTLEAHPAPAGLAWATTGPPQPGQVGIDDRQIVSRLASRIAVADVDSLGATGPHNLANAVAAVAAALCVGAEPSSLSAPLAAFRAGPHRLEQVAVVEEVAYVNDSKATNPHAAAAALMSFGVPHTPSIVWIAGGLNKGLDFSDLSRPMQERVRAVVTIGRSGPELAALSRVLGVQTVEAGTLGRAVPAAAELARPGDTVLLAPACASMDQFTDYAERGQAFRDAVAVLARAPRREGTHGR